MKKWGPILLSLVLAVSVTIPMAAPVFAAQAFNATITITGQPSLPINAGETTTLSAEWKTNRYVTKYQWIVDKDVVKTGDIPKRTRGKPGSYTFDFSPYTSGEVQITFRIFDPTHTDRDAFKSVTVGITERLVVLNPRGEIVPPPAVPISPRVTDLAGKRIGLYWNNKTYGNFFWDAVEELLKEKFPTATILRYEGPYDLGDTTAKKIAKEVDTLITGVGD